MPGIFRAAVLCCCLALSTVHADDRIEEALSGTFHVFGENSSATGFIVQVKDQNVLVTAEHVFAKMRGEECKLALREKTPEGFARREHAVRIRNGKDNLWQKHPQQDLAAIRVELPAGVVVIPYQFSQLADEPAFEQKKVRVAQEVWIPCYPAQVEANRVGWPVLRRGNIASHPLAPLKASPTFLVDFNTFGGDSGAPVLVHQSASASGPGEDNPLLIGVVLGMIRQTDKSQMPFEERTVHTPLGISIVANSQQVREIVQKVASP